MSYVGSCLDKEIAQTLEIVTRSQNWTVFGVDQYFVKNIQHQQSHGKNTMTYLAVSLAIARERGPSNPVDSRFWTSNQIYLTRVAVQFTQNYSDTIRLRMICYKSAGSSIPHLFIPKAIPRRKTVDSFALVYVKLSESFDCNQFTAQ